MQWGGLSRVFPLRTVLLLCSVPLMAFAIFAAWFRLQLPPLKGFYLMAYWESSTTADNPYNTTEFQWLNKTAPGRKSVPVIPHDVDSNGSGFLVPIGLSRSAREQGWVRLEKTPVETVGSAQLEAFLQSQLYDNLSIGQVLAVPLLYLCFVPFIVLYIAIWMKQGLVAEWGRFYEELHDYGFALNSHSFRKHFQSRIAPWIDRTIAGTKSRIWRFKSAPHSASHYTATDEAVRTQIVDDMSPSSTPPSVVLQKHSIFPGASAFSDSNSPPKPWDESQWID